MRSSSTMLAAILGLALLTSRTLALAVPAISARLPATTVTALKAKIAALGGCNANICFAMDGSDAMSPVAFTNQKNFVLDVASVIGVDEPAEFAAVQYATYRKLTSPLTGDSAKFILTVNNEAQLGGGSATAEGIALCSSQLRQRPREANKIVLLSDGLTTTGRNALWRAEMFRWRGGELSVVAAGTVNEKLVFALAGFRKDRVFRVDSFLDVLALQRVVEEMVVKICDIKGGKPQRPGFWRGGRSWGNAR